MLNNTDFTKTSKSMSLNFTAAQLIIEGLGYLQQGAAMEAPITELANDITDSIDLAEPSGELVYSLAQLMPLCMFVGIVRLLQQCDAQIFTGWRQYQVIHHECCCNENQQPAYYAVTV